MPTHPLKNWLKKTTPLTGTIIDAAWPDWWSQSMENDEEATDRLKKTLSNRLGLDQSSLESKPRPVFIWDDHAKYKNLTTSNKDEISHLQSFGFSIANILLKGCRTAALTPPNPYDVREAILEAYPIITLESLVEFSWSIGIPILHLGISPLTSKRMCAMSIRTNIGSSILISRDNKFPAPVIFYIAHELGHLAKNESQVFNTYDEIHTPHTSEEEHADAYAIKLLTGHDEILFTGNTSHTPFTLAKDCLRLAIENRIEPGTIALCYGFATKNWKTAFGSLNYIYTAQSLPRNTINSRIKIHIDASRIPEDYNYITNLTPTTTQQKI